jgi:hypothetical protein
MREEKKLKQHTLIRSIEFIFFLIHSLLIPYVRSQAFKKCSIDIVSIRYTYRSLIYFFINASFRFIVERADSIGMIAGK